MMDYLLRLILCSAFFIAIYYGFLQNERMYRFNRFYLLVTAIVSVLIPLLNFESSNAAVVVVEKIITRGSEYAGSTLRNVEVREASTLSLSKVTMVLYILIGAILMTRLLLFNRLLLKKTKQCKRIQITDAILVLSDSNHPPHSFLSYIFISRSAYENGAIDEKIIDHERAHVTQRHTLDVLFIELLRILFWFNPIFYFYGNAIRLNHEYLADEAVLVKHKNKQVYQDLLINHTALLNGFKFKRALSCPFNYLKTKKRLKMMSKMKLTRRIVLKQCLLAPVIVIAVVLFSKNTVAQEMKDVVVQVQTTHIPVYNDTEDELQNKFDALLKPFIKERNGRVVYYGIGKEAQQKLIPLYEKMSEAQKAEQVVRYWPGLPERKPTKEEFESWKSSSQYGVWLNEKRVSNDDLSKFAYSDIAYYSKSRLGKNAKNYGKHVYQVDARTNDNFRSYTDHVKAEPHLVFLPKRR